MDREFIELIPSYKVYNALYLFYSSLIGSLYF